MNVVMYKKDGWPNIQFCVSETKFDRSMSQLARGAEGTRTITFPSTVREVEYDAFEDNWSLRSAVLNEGLEILEGYRDENGYYIGVFSNSGLQRVTLPSTLKVMTSGIFNRCGRLKRVLLTEGSKLEQIGPDCFSGTAIDEFLAPQSLREIGDGAFSCCSSLERVVLNEGLERLGELRSENCNDHCGVFSNTLVKSVTLPSTLRVLGDRTFYGCDKLKCATFAADSQLKTIGDSCF